MLCVPASKKSYQFEVTVGLEELSSVPFVNGVMFAKLRLLDTRNSKQYSTRLPIKEHAVRWNSTHKFLCRILANVQSSMLEHSQLKVSIRKEVKGGKSYNKMGYALVNVSCFANLGNKQCRRRYILEGYNQDRRQDNSMLQMHFTVCQLFGDPCFRVPEEDRSKCVPYEVVSTQSRALLLQHSPSSSSLDCCSLMEQHGPGSLAAGASIALPGYDSLPNAGPISTAELLHNAALAVAAGSGGGDEDDNRAMPSAISDIHDPDLGNPLIDPLVLLEHRDPVLDIYASISRIHQHHQYQHKKSSSPHFFSQDDEDSLDWLWQQPSGGRYHQHENGTAPPSSRLRGPLASNSSGAIAVLPEPGPASATVPKSSGRQQRVELVPTGYSTCPPPHQRHQQQQQQEQGSCSTVTTVTTGSGCPGPAGTGGSGCSGGADGSTLCGVGGTLSSSSGYCSHHHSRQSSSGADCCYARSPPVSLGHNLDVCDEMPILPD